MQNYDSVSVNMAQGIMGNKPDNKTRYNGHIQTDKDFVFTLFLEDWACDSIDKRC